MQYDFSGKSVVVTGAASGMGLATARAFALSGASVVLADVNSDQGEKAAESLRYEGANAVFHRADVSQEKDVAALTELAKSHGGKLDVYVSAAGVLGNWQNLDSQEGENLDFVFGVNVNGVVFGIKHAVAAMRETGNCGVIVNFSSVQGFRVHREGAGIYAASKAAVVSLTKSGAMEFGEEGIRVVGIAPGPIDTPMLRHAAGNNWPPSIVAVTPLARLGEPDEVAKATLWLASDEASYVTGATLAVDGGFLAP